MVAEQVQATTKSIDAELRQELLHYRQMGMAEVSIIIPGEWEKRFDLKRQTPRLVSYKMLH